MVKEKFFIDKYENNTVVMTVYVYRYLLYHSLLLAHKGKF